MAIFRDFQSGARRSGAPATVVLVAALAATYVLAWFGMRDAFGRSLMFLPVDAFRKPWTFLTYPFGSNGDGNNVIGMIFLLWWLWGIGGSVERDLGSGRYLVLFFAEAVLGGLFYWVGYEVLGDQQPLFGAFMPVAAVTVAWGTRNADAPVNFMFVIPVLGKWIAWISVALVFFGTNSPRLAAFACVPLVFAYLFAANKLPFAPYARSFAPSGKPASKRAAKKEAAYFDDVRRREKERSERERLRKLFESSLSDEDK